MYIYANCYQGTYRLKKIKSKLIALFAGIILFTLALSTFISYQYRQFIDNTKNVNQEMALIKGLSTQLKIEFLTQGNSWKNILLRGYNDEKYKFYVAEFKELTTLIKTNVDALQTATQKYKALNIVAAEFGTAVSMMSQRYLEALPVYKLAEHNPHVTADKYVRGVNHDAIELIAKLQNETKILEQQQLASLNERFIFMEIVTLVIAIILIAIIAIAFLITIRHSIVIPLQNATDLMKNIAHGDRDLTLRINTSKEDEIATLNGFYNAFLDNIHDLMGQIATTANGLASASKNTSRITEVTNQAIRTQQGAISKVADAMSEMAKTVQHVASSANEASINAEQTHKEAENGHKIVMETGRSINQLSLDVHHAEGVITNLSEQSQNIGKIVNAITEVSDQTNLLALNAAIEAARAGEHGRGFAVVAAEVRTLAGKTQAATEEIQAMITSIQSETNSAVKAMTASRVQAQKTVVFSAQAGDALERIMSSITTIEKMNSDIAFASEQQSQVAHAINDNVYEINCAVEQTLDNSQKSTSENGDLAQLALLLHTLISQFKLADEVMDQLSEHELSHDNHALNEIELF